MEPDTTASVVGFARTLRAAGVPATTDRVQAFMASLDTVDHTRRDDVYWSGRVTFCGSVDDLERYDRVFAAYFDGRQPRLRPRTPAMTIVRPAEGDNAASPRGTESGDDTAVLQAHASATELLRHMDFESLSDTERDAVARWLATFRLPGEPRRTRRWRADRAGAVDRRRTVRQLLRHGGEPVRLRHRTHRRRPRRVVILADVSGSMSSYATALLRFAHAATQGRAGRTEVFTIGTRLTRVTREMSHRDPDTAMAELSTAVPDWSGGTRLGELVKGFLDRWGQRGMARGAVVVVLSDGWEQGDATLLGEQMARLSRLAHRVVWANPRKARPGYAPLVAGMAVALPYIDDFVAGNSVAALEELARVVAGHTHRRRVLYA